MSSNPQTCCEEKGHLYCGRCRSFNGCDRIKGFYSQPGYDKLRQRMLQEVDRSART